MLRGEAGAQPFASRHRLVEVIVCVVGVPVEAGPVVDEPVVGVVAPLPPPLPPIVVDAPGRVVVVVVLGTGAGATSWRKSPPGHAMPPTITATSTTPSATGRSTLARACGSGGCRAG